MNRESLPWIEACIVLSFLIILGVIFVAVPDGWNLIPLGLMVLVVAVASARWRTLRPAQRAEREAMPDSREPANAGAGGTEPGQCSTLPGTTRRLNRAFGPVVAGLIIDLVDLATFGPIGLFLGLLVGGLAGYWMGRALGLSRKSSLYFALVAGVYCTIPGTEFIPLATLAGAYARFRESGKRTSSDFTTRT